MILDVGKTFYYRLTNRDKNQGDGKHTAVDFRNQYLSDLDNKKAWENDSEYIVLNFKNVKKLGPSFANEAFAYFTQYATPELIFSKIKFNEISSVKRLIIERELKSGYKPSWKKIIGL